MLSKFGEQKHYKNYGGKIMKYELITVDCAYVVEARNEMKKEVDRLLQKGWKPQGGASISTYQVGYRTYCSIAQAMVLEEDEPAPRPALHVNMI